VYTSYGESVKSWVANKVPIGTALAAHLLAEMILCIEQMHSAGYVHGDITPGNFVLNFVLNSDTYSERPSLCVIDLGLATSHEKRQKDFDRKRKQPGVEGSEPYVSLAGEDFLQISYKDDVEAIGYVVWEMLAGKLPWDGQPLKTMAKMKRGVFSRPDLPPMIKLVLEAREKPFGSVPDYRGILTRLIEYGYRGPVVEDAVLSDTDGPQTWSKDKYFRIMPTSKLTLEDLPVTKKEIRLIKEAGMTTIQDFRRQFLSVNESVALFTDFLQKIGVDRSIGEPLSKVLRSKWTM